MSSSSFSRRKFLVAGMTGAAVSSVAFSAQGQPKPAKSYQEGLSPWPLVMNTSTIRPATFEEKLRVTADAGWDGIEPWIDELEKYEEEGGDLKELNKRIKDMGLYVPNIIGLWNAMPATAEAFEHSLPETRERMRRAADVGSIHIAAIPGPDREDFDLKRGAEMYSELMRIGREDYGITVAFEFVGFFKGVHRLGQACAVALDTNDEKACLIMDTFHLFRGGSGFNGLGLIQGDLIANFHVNDVPADVPREEQGDEHRVYPGDGILPTSQILQTLQKIGYDKALSLEIFKREYWELPPEQVAADGLRKLRTCIANAAL